MIGWVAYKILEKEIEGYVVCNLQKLESSDQKSGSYLITIEQFWKQKSEVVEFQRLPIKFGVQDESRTHTPNWALPPQSSASTNSATWTKKRAKDGTRTRDPDLGKVVLYQLSYFRNQSTVSSTVPL